MKTIPVRLKMEGCAIHPDDTDADLSDDAYEWQLTQYFIETLDGDAFEGCVRDEIANRLRLTFFVNYA